MSGKATGWVLENGPHPDHIGRDGRPYGKRARGLRSVLVAVADSANPEGGHSHPGIDRVARFALYSRRQTIDLMAELVAEGWLSVEHKGTGRGDATAYQLHMERVRPAHPIADTESVRSDPEGVQSEPESVRPRVHPNVETTDSNGTPAAQSAEGGEMFPVPEPAPGRTELAVRRERSDLADGLLKAWWDRQTPRPTQNYMGCRKVIERLLEARWWPEAIEAALSRSPIVTAAALELALRRANPTPPAAVDADRDGPEGRMAYVEGEWKAVP